MIGSWRSHLLQTAFRFTEMAVARSEPKGQAVAPGQILVLTAYTPDIACYGDISAANKERYARRHGYAFRAITSGFVTSRPPAWSKIHFIREALRTHRFVFWTDADSLVMNDAVRLESLIMPDADVHLTRALTPFPHINTGHMLLRRSPFTALFLWAVWRLEIFTHDSTWEQRAINYLVDHYRLSRVLISPNRRFNSYGHVPNDPDPYQPGDFIIHFPGLPEKTPLLARYATEAQAAAGPGSRASPSKS